MILRLFNECLLIEVPERREARMSSATPMGPGRRVVRRVEAPGHEEMESGLPVPLQWGMRITRAVRHDELHDDAPKTVAAMRELRAAATPFPDVPVVVLSAARGFPRRFRAHWTRLQAGLAASAPQGRQVVVDGTGHNVPRDRPDMVAGAILAVAAQVRAGGG